MSGIVGGNLGRGSGLIKAGAIDDNSVTLAKMAGLARGNLIYGDTSGDPAALAVGGANEVLTHDGTDFDWAAAAGGGDLSFGGDTFGADKVIGANDAYSLSLETSGNTALTISASGEITKPLQPGFSVGQSTSQTLDTTDAIFAAGVTEIFDQNGDFTSGVFTAPVTGKYLFQVCAMYESVSAGEIFELRIYASNRNFYISDREQYAAGSTGSSGYKVTTGAVILDMDASDTAYVAHQGDNGSATHANVEWCHMQGWLLG